MTEVQVAPAEDPGNPATVGISRLVSALVKLTLPTADASQINLPTEAAETVAA